MVRAQRAVPRATDSNRNDAFKLGSTRQPARLRATIGFLLLILSALLATAAHAQSVHIDMTVQENLSDGRLSVHGFDFDTIPALAIVQDKRVFVRGVTISGNSVFSENPGFYSTTDTTALTPAALLAPAGNESLLFNVLAAPTSTMPSLGGRTLSWWDGSLPVSWGPAADPDEGIEIIKGFLCCPDNQVTVDGSTSDIVGFPVGAASGGGFLHEHMKFLLLPDNGALPPAGPEDGVYLMLMEVSYPSYVEWIPAFFGVEAFAGGQSTQIAAINAITTDLLNPLCSDGIDNDKDGKIDFGEDDGCVDAQDMSERGAVGEVGECDNGIDDDGDGLIDFHDLDGDGESDYLGDNSCLHPTNAIEVVPEPGFSIGLGVGLVALAQRARRDRSRPRRC